MSPQNFVLLPNRGIVTVAGPDSFSFLQNIITQDLELLDNSSSVHACLLTPQGKYLHDFFVIRTDPTTYVLDCEGSERARDLARRLGLYKLSADVTIHSTEHTTTYHVFPDGPRLLQTPEGTEIPFVEWDQWRITQGIPDGSRDAEIGVSTLAEINLDQRTVSYTKGCYIGQELVARMHNRNLGKKHLVAVEFLGDIPTAGTEIENIGMMRSSAAPYGLILMTYETENRLKESPNSHDQIRLLGL